VEFVVDKVTWSQVFSEYFGFALPILIPPTSPHSSSSSRAGTIGQRWAGVPSELGRTAPHPKKLKKKKR
jgi:hypothetical protein